MEKFLFCIESFTEHSVKGLCERLDDLETPAGTCWGSGLSYAVAIQCESRKAAEEILDNAYIDLQCMYSRFLKTGWLNPLISSEVEEVIEGHYECYGSRASIFRHESVEKIWGVSAISNALKQYNSWLLSSDERKDLPDNRECVLLRNCEEQAHARRSFRSSLATNEKLIGEGDSATPSEATQREKERVAYEAWAEGLTLNEIVERLKERFGDSPGIDAARNWAENHWKREHPGEPFPKRKSGRRKSE